MKPTPMLTKLSTGFTFSIELKLEADRWCTYINLHQLETGKTKVFKIAGVKGDVHMVNHMHSLTDEQCSQWFNERQEKKQKKSSIAPVLNFA